MVLKGQARNLIVQIVCTEDLQFTFVLISIVNHFQQITVVFPPGVARRRKQRL